MAVVRQCTGILAAGGLALLLVAARPAPVQSLMARNLAARGGQARLAAIRSLSASGYLQLPGGRAQLRVRSQAPNRLRVDLIMPGAGTVVQAYDGHRAWQMGPGEQPARYLSGDAARQVEDQALGFVGMAVAPRRAGTRVTYAGKGRRQGRAYEALRFTLVTGDQFVQYYDAKTGLAFYEQYPAAAGTGAETIGDFRRVDGLLFPFRFVNQPDSAHPVTLQLQRIQLDQPLDPAIFRFPG